MNRYRFPFSGALVILFGALGARAASGQTCLAASDSSVDMTEMIKSYAMATDSVGRAARDSLRIPAVTSSSSITLVTKEATCKSATKAYQREVTGHRTSLSGKVFVVRVGSAYVVWDPAFRTTKGLNVDVFMVFDSKWKYLSGF